MTRIALLIGGLVMAVALVAPGLGMAQDAGLDGIRKVDTGKTAATAVDFAAARADAQAKANNKASLDSNVDVKNKLDQKQSAVGIGYGGNASVKNQNINKLSTGDVTNTNTTLNANTQILSIGSPIEKRR
jgi:hypothetical protein